jgi:hypothetical protein
VEQAWRSPKYDSAPAIGTILACGLLAAQLLRFSSIFMGWFFFVVWLVGWFFLLLYFIQKSGFFFMQCFPLLDLAADSYLFRVLSRCIW